MIAEAKALTVGLSASLRKAHDRIYKLLVDESGCDVYVKTIYVGFTIDGAMVAAVYPRGDRLEVAMALPENIDGPEFKDATHLTWPTMPVAMEVRTPDELVVALDHLRDAANRVRTGEHDVVRPNDHFIGRVKRGNNRA